MGSCIQCTSCGKFSNKIDTMKNHQCVQQQQQGGFGGMLAGNQNGPKLYKIIEGME